MLRTTAAGQKESHAHDVVITKEAPTIGLSVRPFVGPVTSAAVAERRRRLTRTLGSGAPRAQESQELFRVERPR